MAFIHSLEEKEEVDKEEEEEAGRGGGEGGGMRVFYIVFILCNPHIHTHFVECPGLSTAALRGASWLISGEDGESLTFPFVNQYLGNHTCLLFSNVR